MGHCQRHGRHPGRRSKAISIPLSDDHIPRRSPWCPPTFRARPQQLARYTQQCKCRCRLVGLPASVRVGDRETVFRPTREPILGRRGARLRFMTNNIALANTFGDTGPAAEVAEKFPKVLGDRPPASDSPPLIASRLRQVGAANCSNCSTRRWSGEASRIAQARTPSSWQRPGRRRWKST